MLLSGCAFKLLSNAIPKNWHRKNVRARAFFNGIKKICGRRTIRINKRFSVETIEKKNRGKKKPGQKKKEEPEQEGVNKEDSREGIRAYARGRAYIPDRFGGVTPYTDPNDLIHLQEQAAAAGKGKKKKQSSQTEEKKTEEKKTELQDQPKAESVQEEQSVQTEETAPVPSLEEDTAPVETETVEVEVEQVEVEVDEDEDKEG